LHEELRLPGGLDEVIEENKFNENQLRLMSLARVFCSRADVYVMDSPFSGLTAEAVFRVEKLLRRRQEQGVLVVMALKKSEHMRDQDHVIIINLAATKEIGTFH
jgi:ABC-type multidrug transport system ATPase subunit